MKSLKEIANELAQIQRYRYYVERYTAGLKQLTVVARSMQDTGDEKFITFVTVEYMQMPTYWENSPFLLGTPQECCDFLKNVSIEIKGKLPSLFYVQLPKSYVYVVCWSVGISDTMPL